MAFVDLNDSIIAQVRNAADLVEFVQQVTPLRLAGRKYKGLCPFHREKTPSFEVDRDKGLFYCFGCHTGGDIFKFLALTERMTFPEAVEHVASRVGIELPRKRKTQKENEQDDVRELMDDASAAFHQALGWKPNAADGYLRNRDVSEDVIRRFGFGFAPDSWDYLLRRLGQKYGEKRLEAAGLIMPRREKSGYYDRFRNRLMIPIHSESGAIVGFGGRSLDGSDPKYLNSPESELFNKSRLLYNLHRSRDGMRRYDRAILVEGYFDAIAIDAAGIPGVVASMGTSLTAGQASLLRRFTRNVVMAYDGDTAGRTATLRAAQVLLAAGLNVEVLELDGAKDPDDLVKSKGADRLIELLSEATDIVSFALKQTEGDPAGLNAREKSERVEALMPILSSFNDPVLRNEAAQRIADAFNLQFETIWSRVRTKATSTGGADRERAPVAPPVVGEKFVLLAAFQGRLTAEQRKRLHAGLFDDPGCRSIFAAAQEWIVGGKPVDFGEVTTHLRGESELTLLAELQLTSDIEESALERLDENLRPMERSYVDRRAQQVQRDIVEAEKSGDSGRLDQLIQEKLDLSRMLSSLK